MRWKEIAPSIQHGQYVIYISITLIFLLILVSYSPEKKTNFIQIHLLLMCGITCQQKDFLVHDCMWKVNCFLYKTAKMLVLLTFIHPGARLVQDWCKIGARLVQDLHSDISSS